MKSGRRLLAAGAVCLTAFGVGHVMQYGLSSGLFEGGGVPARAAGVFFGAGGGAEGSRLPVLPEVQPALPPTRVSVVASADAPPARIELPGPLSAFGLACGPELTAERTSVASLRVRLSAPCRPNERVEVRHAGLAFAVETSSMGLVDVTVPALMRRARIDAVLADGTALSATSIVSDLYDVRRVAIASDGAVVLAINAFEFGASPGEAGHVRHEHAAQTPMSDAGGQVVRLGDPNIAAPLQSEVYTLPLGRSLTAGAVRLHVEAIVSDRTCGRPVAARVLQPMPGGAPVDVALTLDMPGCDAVGDILVLKNVLRDLRLARN